MSKCLGAWTAPRGYRYYPAYFNATLISHKDVVELTIREPEGREKPSCGTVVSVGVPVEDFRKMLAEMVDALRQERKL
ncbi:MAG: hypothetical protein KGL39_03205 [Patescibacteria group bacterium]|nr:hypothetical protein [Patescibacteria group bacterium]